MLGTYPEILKILKRPYRNILVYAVAARHFFDPRVVVGFEGREPLVWVVGQELLH